MTPLYTIFIRMSNIFFYLREKCTVLCTHLLTQRVNQTTLFAFFSLLSMARRRHLSRIAVMQTLFEAERRDIDIEETLMRNSEELGGIDEEFGNDLLVGVMGKEDDIREAIEKHAPEWSLERMDPIARCVLLVGAYEILYGDDAPPAVVMNEAIDIAKEFGTAESGKFVNGVLNAIAHKK